MKNKVLILMLAAAIVTCFSGCSKNDIAKAESQSNKNVPAEMAIEREYNDKGQVRSFLTGQWVDKDIGERRPIAVMLSNIKKANPMSGVSKADVLYEAPVEGEITRMMGIFEDYDGLDKIGSVRSCREYFLFWALEFDAVYCHYGQSSYAVEYLERDYADNLSGLAAIGGTVFYRTDDRPAPHNAYASAKGIAEGIKKLKYRKNYNKDYNGKFKFAKDQSLVSLEPKKITYIKPGYNTNKPWFEYNENDKKYYRFQFNAPHIDDMNDEQLSFTNVIIQYADWENRGDTEYLAFDCHSEGYALIFTNGTVCESHWIREGDQDNGEIHYYDLGLENEIVLNQGKTMVCVVKDMINNKMNTNVEFR